MAARYWVNGGTGNWNSTSNWSATSGGASGASVPGTADDVTFDGAGNSNATASTTYTINSLTITSGYSSTLAIGTSTITINTNLNINPAVGFSITSSTGIISIGSSSGTSNITTNGYIMPTALRLGHQSGSGGSTINLIDNLNVSGALTLGQAAATGNVTINGNNIYPSGNVATNGASGARIVTGSSVLNFTGSTTQTLSSSAQGGVLRLPIIVNKSSGTLAIGDLSYDTGTFTRTAGTVTHLTGTLTIGASTTFASSGISWNNVTVTSTSTITLSNTFTVVGNFTITGSNVAVTISGATFFTSIGGNLAIAGPSGDVFTPANNMTVGGINITAGTTATINSYTISCSGNFSITTSQITGTGTINMIGSGTITGSQTTNYIGLPFIINTSGTYTWSGTIHFQGSTLTHTQGTTAGGSSTITFDGTMAINNIGLNFNILDLDGNTTFTSTGSFGWTTNTLQSVTGTHTYQAGATYTVSSLLQLIGTAASRIVMLSSVGGSRAYFNLSPTGTQTNGYVNTTDIDSSGGLTIFDWQGVLSNTVNWNLLTPPQTSAYTFVS